MVTEYNKHEFYTGGGFDTTMTLEDGTVEDSGEGCFLELIENERIAFTDALQGGCCPNDEAFFSAVIPLEEHLERTLYTATALHKNDKDRQWHAELGFVDGWGTTLDQLAGAFYGIDGIPLEWCERVTMTDEITAYADALFEIATTRSNQEED